MPVSYYIHVSLNKINDLGGKKGLFAWKFLYSLHNVIKGMFLNKDERYFFYNLLVKKVPTGISQKF